MSISTSISTRFCAVLLCLIVFYVYAPAQAPTGEVDGTVFDSTGAVIPGATLTLTSRSTGGARTVTSSPQGTFTFPSLISGGYELRATAAGFRTLVEVVTVETGAIVTADLHMQVGASKEVVTVEALAASLDYDRQTIDGVVSREQIDSLPLNGRSFLQLAQLEPGVGVGAAATGQYNAQFNVSVLGRGSESIRITVDGATVNDSVTGGTQQNFSQDVIEEFQISSANFDLSTGITAGGAVNIVTRTGTNDFHGAGYFFYRDHNMAAYPYLERDPHDLNPYFARKDPGFYLGGPILKDKLFFFTSYEHNNTDAAVSTYPNDPLFTSFATYATSPYTSNQFTERLDYRLNQKHSMFLRYSHDGNNTFAPSGGGTQPSNWGVNTNWADSGVFSVISALTPATTNEVRFSMTYWSNYKNAPTSSVCPAPCVGLGGPQFSIDGIGNFQIGNDASNTPQSRMLRRYITADNYSWQKGSHSIKFGGEWEYQKGTGTYAYADPGGVVLYSPEEVGEFNAYLDSLGAGAYAIKIPSSFTTLQDILQLPVAGFEIGVGDPTQPPSYDRGSADHNNRFHFYAQDNWKVTPKFTLIYGLAWSYESDLLNYDLTKPQYLEPILGANGLGHEQHQPNNWSPSLGFAWNVGGDNKTVIRGGAGMYYDTMNIEVRLLERAALGPLGTGRALLPDSLFLPLLDQAFGISQSSPLPVTALANFPTVFNGADFEAILPTLQAAATQQLQINPNNTNLAIRNINVFKTSPGQDIFVNDFRPPYSQQASLGLQRQVTNDLVVSADFVYRHFLRERIRGTDLNHWLSVTGPVIPACTGAEAANPLAECSTGPIDFDVSGGRSTYKGLLLRVDKRFTRKFSFLASYAYQVLNGFNGVVNDYDWFASNGPQIGRQSLTFSGTYKLPWGFEISNISTFASRGPFEPVINNVDPTGAGLPGDLPLPGAGYNQFGITLGTSDLVRLVNAFNQQYAGTVTPRNQKVPTITLPANFSFGRNSFSMDFRLTKAFKLYKERAKLLLFGEVFNVLNYANLGGYNNELTSSTFGQPTSVPSQVLGSGGPRIFQLGGRVQF
jgi:outer membrane receptor for ferrienterochelin and colicin